MTLLKLRTTWVWALLVIVTCLSWESVQGLGLLSDHRMATALVMAIAFIKVRFIMLDFMEIRDAPLPLRLFAEIWVIAICAAIIGMYWTGAGGPAPTA